MWRWRRRPRPSSTRVDAELINEIAADTGIGADELVRSTGYQGPAPGTVAEESHLADDAGVNPAEVTLSPDRADQELDSWASGGGAD